MRATSRSPRLRGLHDVVLRLSVEGLAGGAGQSTRTPPSRLTIAGSRWSKNSDSPVSRRGDAGHLVVGELEVEHVEVLGHPLGTHRLGDDDDAALDQPAQHDLGHRLAVRVGDRTSRVGSLNRLFLPSANGPHDSICTPCSAMSCWSSARWWNGWVSTWLTAGVTSLWVMRSTSRSAWKFETPIARTRPSRVQLLHRAPRAVVVAVGLVDQVEVDVVEAEAAQRGVERPPGVVLGRRPGSTAWW